MSHAYGQAEQRIPDNLPRVIVGHVRERRVPRYAIADRVDAAVGRLEFAIDGNAGMVVTNSRSVEAEAIDRGLASGGNQQVAAGDRLLGAGGLDGGRDRCPRHR